MSAGRRVRGCADHSALTHEQRRAAAEGHPASHRAGTDLAFAARVTWSPRTLHPGRSFRSCLSQAVLMSWWWEEKKKDLIKVEGIAAPGMQRTGQVHL